MNFSRLPDILARARIPELTDLLAAGAEFHLVGGTLRDLLLGLESNDFDFAGPFDPTPLARAFAGRIGGHWFPLDPVRQQSRVVAGRGAAAATYDFAPYRGPDLEADLRLRDFTVNALVLPLGPEPGEPLDPLGGLEDLRAGRLRACSSGVFEDDPLRVLKGVRHAAVLGFAFEEETAARMRRTAALLRRIAPERVRAELAAIMSAPDTVLGLTLLEEFGLLPILFGPLAGGGSAAAGIDLVERLDRILAAAAADSRLAPLLDFEFEAGLDRPALLRLAAFLRGLQPADAAGHIDNLRLGRRAAAAIRHLLELPAKPAAAADCLPDRQRSRALWAAEIGGSVPDSLILLALLHPEPPEAALAALRPVILDYLDLAPEGRVADLIDGNWAREELGIPAGPELGKALAALRQAEIEGRVAGPEQAREFLRQRQEKD